MDEGSGPLFRAQIILILSPYESLVQTRSHTVAASAGSKHSFPHVGANQRCSDLEMLRGCHADAAATEKKYLWFRPPLVFIWPSVTPGNSVTAPGEMQGWIHPACKWEIRGKTQRSSNVLWSSTEPLDQQGVEYQQGAEYHRWRGDGGRKSPSKSKFSSPKMQLKWVGGWLGEANLLRGWMINRRGWGSYSCRGRWRRGRRTGSTSERRRRSRGPSTRCTAAGSSRTPAGGRARGAPCRSWWRSPGRRGAPWTGTAPPAGPRCRAPAAGCTGATLSWRRGPAASRRCWSPAGRRGAVPRLCSGGFLCDTARRCVCKRFDKDNGRVSQVGHFIQRSPVWQQ